MIYIDNSATTKQYPQVTETMIKYMEEYFGNPSSMYQLGLDSEKAVKHARKQVEEAMGAGNGTLIFTSGGTEADNTAIFGAARALRRRGNRIITSAVEHPAVLECCKRLEQDGYDIVYVGVDDNCRLDLERLEDAIDENTILVSLMQVNNEAGTIMPVDAVKDLMKKKNAPGWFHCDAVQSFGKLQVPESADLISVSSQKIHGPKGAGSVMRRTLLKGLKDNLEDLKINSVEEDGVASGQCCSSILNISFLGTRGEVLLHTLEQDGIYVSTGSACSSNKKGQSHVLGAMGLKDKEIEGALRFSFGRFNEIDEMEIVVDKVTAAVKRFRRLGSFR